MSDSVTEKCRELAGFALSSERGLNTPARRQLLASSLEKLVKDYIAFEREKLRYGRQSTEADR
ncbi:hypothetical protein [Bradyrhizobium sp.]|uniref:hypothetical protein n=1 Tax=Bradyrhizobium sp. TaxID=376 RepID=UPI0025C01D79|nr:hypothetical protein [Bradyrhizobium sp.]